MCAQRQYSSEMRVFSELCRPLLLLLVLCVTGEDLYFDRPKIMIIVSTLHTAMIPLIFKSLRAQNTSFVQYLTRTRRG